MPVIIRNEDGSMYDYENGYRSAETVARQKEEGTYTEPEFDEWGWTQVLKATFILLVAAALGLAAYSIVSNVNEANADKETVSTTLIQQGGFEDVIEINEDYALVSAVISEQGELGVVKCDLVEAQKEKTDVVYAFCGGNVALMEIALD